MDERTILKILGLHRAEFEQAKTKQTGSWVCEAVVSVAAILAILVGVAEPYLSALINVAWMIYALSISALAACVLKWVFSFQAKRHKNLAERARRVLLLVKGLGYVVSQKELTDLIAHFSATDEEGKHWEDPSYFLTTGEPGDEQLARMLQQSAFFSKHLYTASAKRDWSRFAMTFLGSLVVLFILPGVASQRWSIAIAQVICTLLVFLISIDFLGRALEYCQASAAVGRVDDRLEEFRGSKSPKDDLLLILGDYNAAVQEAPLIPRSVYEKNRKRLNRLFSQRIAALTAKIGS